MFLLVITNTLMLSLLIDAFEKVAGDHSRRQESLPACQHIICCFYAASWRDCRLSHFCKTEYKKFVVIKNRKRVLYIRLQKVLYRFVKLALLWYDVFTGTLKKMSFMLYPYDTCITSRINDGMHCTITWYVDILKCFF